MALQAAFLGCGLTLIGVVVAMAGIIALQPALRSLHWPTTQGIVISARVAQQAGRPRAQVRYQYSVGERTFTGGHLSYHGGRSLPGLGAQTEEAAARAVVARYPPGSETRVYYDPADPQRAVLEPGAGAAVYLPVGAGGLFFLVGLILTLMAFQ